MIINNWPTKKLGKVAEFINGFGFKSNSWSSNGLPIIRIQNLNDPHREFNHFDGHIDNKYHVDNGDVLVSWSGSIGVYKWSLGPALLNQHIFKVGNVDSEVLIDYLFLILQTKVDEIKGKLHGGTMKHITKNLFDNILVSLPPKKEQEKIVKRLNAIRKAQELCDTQIQKTEELFASFLFKEFNFNKDLELKNLEDVATITSSKRIHKSDYVGNGMPFYRTKEIVELSQNKPISLNLFISNDQFSKIKKQFGIPNKGDILISAVGTIGTSWVVSDNNEFYFKDGNLLWIKDFKKVESAYLKYFFDYSFTSVSGLAAGGAYKALTIIKLKQFQIPLPSTSKQKEIIKKLDAIQDYKSLLLKQKSLLKELFDSVLHKSMNGEMDN